MGTFIIGILTPSNSEGLNLNDGTGASSPFVIAIERAGIKSLPSVSPKSTHFRHVKLTGPRSSTPLCLHPLGLRHQVICTLALGLCVSTWKRTSTSLLTILPRWSGRLRERSKVLLEDNKERPTMDRCRFQRPLRLVGVHGRVRWCRKGLWVVRQHDISRWTLDLVRYQLHLSPLLRRTKG